MGRGIFREKPHLVRWEITYREKYNGGLGIRKLPILNKVFLPLSFPIKKKILNKVFLDKWIWRYTL